MDENKICTPPEKWLRSDGSVVSCTESVRVLEDNWNEIRTTFKEALEDAVLMGCTVSQVKQEYKRLIEETECQYKEQQGSQDVC